MTTNRATKLLIRVDPNLSRRMTTTAAQCDMPRHAWIIAVLNCAAGIGPPPRIVQEAPQAEGPQRIVVRATDAHALIWSNLADAMNLKDATWARCMLALACDASYAADARRCVARVSKIHQ